MSFIFQPENVGGNDQTVTRMFFQMGWFSTTKVRKSSLLRGSGYLVTGYM